MPGRACAFVHAYMQGRAGLESEAAEEAAVAAVAERDAQLEAAAAAKEEGGGGGGQSRKAGGARRRRRRRRGRQQKLQRWRPRRRSDRQGRRATSPASPDGGWSQPAPAHRRMQPGPLTLAWWLAWMGLRGCGCGRPGMVIGRGCVEPSRSQKVQCDHRRNGVRNYNGAHNLNRRVARCVRNVVRYRVRSRDGGVHVRSYNDRRCQIDASIRSMESRRALFNVGAQPLDCHVCGPIEFDDWG
eukprot:scaffold15735_cov103-Isochrysis_galbana.AAC.1